MHRNDHQAVTSKEGVGMTARTESRVSSPMLPISKPTCTAQNCHILQQWADTHVKIPGLSQSCLGSSALLAMLFKAAADALVDFDVPHRCYRYIEAYEGGDLLRGITTEAATERKLGVITEYYSFV